MSDMTRDEQIAARFRADTARHQLTILHDDGLYRHLRVAAPGTSMYWFELVTWPGSLAIRGDIDGGHVFSRLDDMFAFFRADASWGINPDYWAEKLPGGRDSVREYSEDTVRQIVREWFVSAVRYSDAPRGLGKAVRSEILDQDLYDEDEARDLLESFEFKGRRFGETWELSFRDYTPHFLWACHAIHHSIKLYDAAKAARAGVAA
ncbi:hypothetical protein ACWF62_17575 [Rhodococcus sp. NPDC054953]